MRTTVFLVVTAFSGNCAVEFHNTGSIEDGFIHVNVFVVERTSYNRKAFFDELRRRFVIGQRNAVQQVIPVAGVADNRVYEAYFCHVGFYLSYLSPRELFFLVRSRDTCRTFGVKVDEQPAAALNVLVADTVSLSGSLE